MSWSSYKLDETEGWTNNGKKLICLDKEWSVFGIGCSKSDFSGGPPQWNRPAPISETGRTRVLD